MKDRPAAGGWYQVLRAAHLIETRLEATLTPLGLSLAKFGVLSELVAAGEPLPLGALADHLSCVRSNVTQLVDRLEADRLVARVADPDDRRSVRAELTEEGRQRQAAAAQILKDADQSIFAGVEPEEREDFLRLLGVLQTGC